MPCLRSLNEWPPLPLALTPHHTFHSPHTRGVNPSGGGAGYFAKLEESGWLRHVRLILCAGVLAAEKLHLEGASVLVHCSDGWDRTAQVRPIGPYLAPI